LYLISVVVCDVEVSAKGRSLVQRIAAECVCGASSVMKDVVTCTLQSVGKQEFKAKEDEMEKSVLVVPGT